MIYTGERRKEEREREACYDKEGTARDKRGELTSSPLLLSVKCRNNYVSTGSDRNIEDATTKCQRSWGEVEGEEEEKEGKSSGTRRLFRKDATKLDGTSGSRLEKYWSMRGEERSRCCPFGRLGFISRLLLENTRETGGREGGSRTKEKENSGEKSRGREEGRRKQITRGS